MFFLTGGPGEPHPDNYVAMVRSGDPGLAWSHGPEPVLKLEDRACTLSEVYVDGGRTVVFVQIHDGSFGEWRCATVESPDDGRTWGAPQPFEPVPRRASIRNRYVASWGEWYLPYQSYDTMDDWTPPPHRDGSFRKPVNGVLDEEEGVLHIAFDHNRHDVIYWGADLP